MLSTIYLFKQEKTSTTIEDDEISTGIELASAFIEKYLDRNLEYQLYRTWQNGTGGNTIQLKEWPITRVYAVADTMRNVAEVKVGDDAIVDWVTLDISSTGVDGSFWYPYSEDIPVEEYANLEDLVANLSAETDLEGNPLFDIKLTSDNYSKIPTMFLRPEVLQLTSNAYTSIYGLYNEMPTRFTLDPDTNRMVYTDFCMSRGLNNIFCWYSAGYVAPVDNEDHTALDTDGTVPRDLIAIVNALANDLVVNVFNNNASALGNGIQSETQGKYSYTKQSTSEDLIPYLTDQVLKYEYILSKYKRLVI